MSNNRSNISIAEDVVTKKGCAASFKEIWEAIVNEKGYSESEAAVELGRFYTQLSLDGHFITLGNNTWDLRSRHTFEESHIDMNDVYDDEDTEEDDSDKDEEEIEYEKQLAGDSESEEKSDDEDNDDEESEEKDSSELY